MSDRGPTAASGGGPTQRELSEAFDARIRDTAKWLIGSFAAVGAALIAGSQLSSIGKLEFCLACGRPWAAIGGVALGIGGVAWAIWLGVQIMVSEKKTLSQLDLDWKHNRSAVHRFFSRDDVFFQKFADFADASAQEKAAFESYSSARHTYRAADDAGRANAKESLRQARVDLQDILARSEALVSLANQVALTAHFRRRILPAMLAAAVIAASGIGVFAWAANPASPTSASMRGADLSNASLVGANLRKVDLSDADLSGADLTGADLRGAVLNGSQLDDVKWASTTCPDGVNGDSVGGTCVNHLTP